jgi:hypothetical protein
MPIGLTIAYMSPGTTGVLYSTFRRKAYNETYE